MDNFFIPTPILKMVSNENHGKLNRSVDVEKLEQAFPDMIGVWVGAHMRHHHAFGEKVDTHIRLIITQVLMENEKGDEDVVMTQDITKEQLRMLIDWYQTIIVKGEMFNDDIQSFVDRL